MLFVCGKNRLRSPTAEHVFADWPHVETASAGINHDADNPVTPELLERADTVFVMENAHRSKLSAKFKRHLSGVKVICLDIPDDFTYMDDGLIAMLMATVPRHLPNR
ncbi:MAG TPA: phosphotyrosine protein phosphatase [Arenimonas sp.]|nr:phosphotyrosine protein phosphatase [Arenimonas sp.]